MIKNCVICGKEFDTGGRSAAVTCSKDCAYERLQQRRAAYRQKRRVGFTPQMQVCHTCGKEFLAAHSEQYYCSRQCQPGYVSPELFKGICLCCGEEFTTQIAHQKFCSKKCRERWRKGLINLAPPPTRKCHDCGTFTYDYRCPDCLAKWREKHHVDIYELCGGM